MSNDAEGTLAARLGAGTTALGASALGFALWVLVALIVFILQASAQGGHFGGIGVVAGAMAAIGAAPVIVSAGALGSVFVLVGRRQSKRRVRTAGNLATAVASVIVALSAYGVMATHADEALAELSVAFLGVSARTVAGATYGLFAMHGAVTLAMGRPGSKLRTWQLVVGIGAVFALGVQLLGGPGELLDPKAPDEPRHSLFEEIASYDERGDEVALSRDAQLLAVVDTRHVITVFDVSSGNEMWKTRVDDARSHHDNTPWLSFSPQGRWLLYADHAHGFTLLGAKSGEIIRRPTCGSGALRSGTFTPDERTLVLGAVGGVCFTSAETGENWATLPTKEDHCHQLASSSHATLVWGVCGFSVTAWDTSQRSIVWQHDTKTKAMAVSPDGSRVLSLGHYGDEPQTLAILDAATGDAVSTSKVQQATFEIRGSLDDGRRWLFYGEDAARIYDVSKGEIVGVVCDDLARAAAAGDRIVTMTSRRNSRCHPDGNVLRLWDASAFP